MEKRSFPSGRPAQRKKTRRREQVDREMNRLPYPVKAILIGLAAAQVLAAVWVYSSNVDLYHKTRALEAAGYLVVPNALIRPSLLKFWPAFWGGLFFTLTVGAGLIAVSLAAAWVWGRILGRSKVFLIPILVLWACGVASVNLKGFNPPAATFFVVVPPVVFWAAIRWMPEPAPGQALNSGVAFIIPLVLLGLSWGPQVDRLFFFNVRDYLLWSNPAGRKVSDFYYRYTLYPAETFKSLFHKTLRTSRLPAGQDRELAARLKSALLKHDYLPLTSDRPVDLALFENKGMLILEHRGRAALELKAEEFLKNPARVLKRFSALTDRSGPLRRAVYYSLLGGLPLVLFTLLFALAEAGAGFFTGPRAARVLAGGLGLLVGLSLLAPIYYGQTAAGRDRNAADLLVSDSRVERLAGLRKVVEQKLEIAEFPVYRKILTGPDAAERYYLAQALRLSRGPETYRDIEFLLEDPQVNVVCMALWALGRRGDRAAVVKVLNKIKTSRRWYVQWYAYRALKDLGWTQNGSG